MDVNQLVIDAAEEAARARIQPKPLQSLSIHYVAHVMKAALGSDPHGTPPGCVTLLLGCFHAITKVRNASALVYHRDLFLAWAALISAHRDQEDLPRFLEEVNTCRCASGPQAVRDALPVLHHSYEPAHAETSFVTVLTHLALAMLHYITGLCSQKRELSEMEGEERRSSRSQRHRLREYKRSCVADILPFGVDESLRGICNWFQLPGPHHYSIYCLLTVVLPHCKSSVIPPFLSSPYLMPAIAEDIRETVKEHNQRVRAGSWVASAQRTALCLGAIVLLLEKMSHHAHDDELSLLYQRAPPGTYHSTLELFSTAVGVLTQITKSVKLEPPADEQSRTALKAYISLASRLLSSNHSMPHNAPSTSLVRVHPNIKSANQKQASEGPKDPAARLAASLRLDQRCSAPDCIETYSRCGRRFQRCSACRTAPYCSIACQRAAWAHPIAPHKAVCDTLKGLGSLMRTLLDEWVPAIVSTPESGLQALVFEKAKELDWTKLPPDGFKTTMANHFELLRASKISYLQKYVTHLETGEDLPALLEGVPETSEPE